MIELISICIYLFTGKKATHDFLSLYTKDSSFPLQDSRPPSHGNSAILRFLVSCFTLENATTIPIFIIFSFFFFLKKYFITITTNSCMLQNF